jgi:ElaB/YqjD/DUF883 family membrane-anchored ribosome-binding protein
MTVAHKFVCSILLLTLLVTQGCDKKKHKAAVPPKMQAPTVAVTLPSEIPLAQEPEEAQPPVVETPTATPPAKPKTKPKKPARNSTSSAKKTTPSATPAATPQTTQGNQTVASAKPPGNPAEALPETMIAAAVPNAQLVQQKEDTARMVDTTENALKGLTRSLSDEEKSMKRQIQSYVRQSRKATEDGDFERAYNLAKKAQILTDALIKK